MLLIGEIHGYDVFFLEHDTLEKQYHSACQHHDNSRSRADSCAFKKRGGVGNDNLTRH